MDEIVSSVEDVVKKDVQEKANADVGGDVGTSGITGKLILWVYIIKFKFNNL